jgi:MFS family permease
VFVGGFAISALGILVIIAADARAVVLVGMAIYGTAFGVITPNLFAATAAAVSTARRARVIGMVRASYYAGPLLAQLFLELVYARFGSRAAVLAIALLCAVALALFFLLRRAFTPVDEAVA